jgi:hypothetical protein
MSDDSSKSSVIPTLDYLRAVLRRVARKKKRLGLGFDLGRGPFGTPTDADRELQAIIEWPTIRAFLRLQFMLQSIQLEDLNKLADWLIIKRDVPGTEVWQTPLAEVIRLLKEPPKGKKELGAVRTGKHKRRMTVEEANQKAQQLAEQMGKKFFKLSEREQADRIGCSWQTWVRTPLFKEWQKQAGTTTQLPKENTPCSPPVVGLTAKLEAVAGEGGQDQVLKDLIADEQQRLDTKRKSEDSSRAELQQLIAEQDADKEPSPLDDDPAGAQPRKVWTRKRL